MTEERRLAAIMFCDVCSYSRMMGEDEGRALAVIGMAMSCIESAAGLFGGRVIKKLGDGALCEFPSAVNAVRCAIEVQRAVAEHNQSASPDQHFQMRIGIHVGDVVVADGDIMGDGVNIASRIQPLAEPGGICISRDVFDLVKSRVSIETVNLGPHDLKNISRQVDIYKVLIDAVGGSAPAPTKRRVPLRVGRKAWLTAAGIAVALIALVALLAAAHAHQARRAYTTATRDAQQLAAAGKTADALQRLRSFPPKYRKTSWQPKIDDTIAQLELRLARETITDRQRRFFKAVVDDDRNAALQLVDPAFLQKADMTAVWAKLRMTTGLFKMTGMGLDNFRIESVDVAADRQSARVWMKCFRKAPGQAEGSWDDIPPAEWRQVQGDWYLHPEPRHPKKPFSRP